MPPRTVQSFWRSHGKPRSLRPPRIVSHGAQEGTAAHIRQLLKKAADDARSAGLPRPLFPFEAADVAAIYTRKKDDGEGLWFALIDGRVFRSTGEPDSTDPDAYGGADG